MKCLFDESPPPYSAIAETPLVEALEHPDAGLPFSHSDDLAAKILALISEGQALDSRFKSICDVVGAESIHHQSVLVLSKRFETLVWESRNIAGSVLVALRDFNDIVLDFLSKQDVAVKDRLKELGNTTKLFQREKESATNQKSCFDAFLKELEDFHQMIRSELDALSAKRLRQSRKGTRRTRSSQYDTIPLLSMTDDEIGRSRMWRFPSAIPPSQPSTGVSVVTARSFFGTTPRTSVDYSMKFEQIGGRESPPWCVISALEVQETKPALQNTMERKRVCPSIEHAESVAALPGIVDTVVHDLRAFTSHIDIFNTVFTELAREQSIFIVHLKDGLSVGNQGYKDEVHRFRRHLPCVCNALDAYSKGKSL